MKHPASFTIFYMHFLCATNLQMCRKCPWQISGDNLIAQTAGNFIALKDCGGFYNRLTSCLRNLSRQFSTIFCEDYLIARCCIFCLQLSTFRKRRFMRGCSRPYSPDSRLIKTRRIKLTPTTELQKMI